MRNNTRLNKKALSNVVATVITIGITIIAIAILTPIIINSIRNPMLSPAVSCNDINILKPLKISDACYNNEGEIKIKLERTFDSIDIQSLTFSLDNNEKARKWECSSGCNNCRALNAGETKFYYLSLGESLNNAALTLSAGECLISRVEITKPC